MNYVLRIAALGVVLMGTALQGISFSDLKKIGSTGTAALKSGLTKYDEQKAKAKLLKEQQEAVAEAKKKRSLAESLAQKAKLVGKVGVASTRGALEKHTAITEKEKLKKAAAAAANEKETVQPEPEPEAEAEPEA